VARTPNAKIPRSFREGMRLVQECLRIIWEAQYNTLPRLLTPYLKFWVIENPATGALRHFLGKPAFIYNPTEFGDNYNKRTALWGKFNEPKRAVLNVQVPRKTDMKYLYTPMSERDREKRTDLRSIASPYFTKAFFLANP